MRPIFFGPQVTRHQFRSSGQTILCEANLATR